MYLKKILATVFTVLTVFLSFNFAYAQNFGLDEAQKGSGLPKTIQNESDLPAVAGKLVNVVLSLVGLFFFGLMIYAGIVWMKSMGSGDEVEKAKNIIQTSIIGLVIIWASYAITNFVFTKLNAK